MLPPENSSSIEPTSVSLTGASHGKTRKIMLSSNSAWNLANFRGPVIEALVAAGDDVIAVAPADGSEVRLRAMGARFRPIRMRGAGTSPVEDLRLLLDYISLLREERPAMFLGFTAKPNIYGSLAARITRVPVAATISGLGSAFLKGGILGGLLLRLYRLALGGAQAIIFQNPADRDLFIAQRVARPGQVRLVAGSGIDLGRFVPVPMAPADAFCFLLIGRLLLDKGVAEFVEAARIVRQSHPHARFQLLGGSADDNPSAVSKADLTRWSAESIVEQLGVHDDVRPYIAAANCVVLPSYREGLPRSLLEGAAMARPLIASDVPGCRDVVEDGVNGLLCAVRSPESLAAAMQRMMAMTPAVLSAMGAAGRRKVEAEFDQRMVAGFYLAEVAR